MMKTKIEHKTNCAILINLSPLLRARSAYYAKRWRKTVLINLLAREPQAILNSLSSRASNESEMTETKRLKGLFFTLDALLGAAIVAIGFIIAMQNAPSITTTSIPFQTLHFESEDALEIMALTQFSDLPNATLRDELLNSTALDNTDLGKSILDIIAFLWATNNVTYANLVAKEMLNQTLPSSHYYNFSIRDISGSEDLILNKTPSKELDSIKTSSASRLVSGFKSNTTSKGHVARAFASKVKTNKTLVFEINPEGSWHIATQDIAIKKKFYIPVESTNNITNGTIFLSVHSGTPADEHSEFRINGEDWEEFEDLNGLTDVEIDNTHLLFGWEDVKSDLVAGWNTLEIRLKSNQFHSHMHPGSRIEVTIQANGSVENATAKKKTTYLDEIFSDKQGNKKSGIWAVMPVYLPLGTTVNNATMYLNFSGITDDNQKNDIQVYFNGNSIYNISSPTPSQNAIINLTSNLSANLGKTNIISIFANVFFPSGSESVSEDESFWGNNDMQLISDPQNKPTESSRIELDYVLPSNLAVYGKVGITRTEQFTGSPSNPKLFSTNFTAHDSSDVFLHLAEIGNINVTSKVAHNGFSESIFFQTPMSRSTPTKIAVGTENLNFSAQNTFNLSDNCAVCNVSGNSSLEYTIYIPGQVGYGKSFSTQAEAEADAATRLNATLAGFVDIIQQDITSQKIGSHNIPYRYGPARAILRVWSE